MRTQIIQKKKHNENRRVCIINKKSKYQHLTTASIQLFESLKVKHKREKKGSRKIATVKTACRRHSTFTLFLFFAEEWK